jgi:hypothetical protein
MTARLNLPFLQISLSPPPEVTALERAFSYFIYDEDKVERTESSINKFAAVTWIGQTVDPTDRQRQHKGDNRLEGKAKMIIINDYKGIFLLINIRNSIPIP